MKVGLYQDPRGAGIGGGEYCLVVLARALRADGHAVDLIHHQGGRFVERLAEFFRTELGGVGDRPLPRPDRWDARDAPARRRGTAMRNWMYDASSPYDLFVCVTHSPPPFNHAKVGLLYVLFPSFDRRAHWPWHAPARGLGRVKAWWRKRVYERWWAERLRSYAAVATLSDFARRWTRDYWGVDSAVVFPPVEVGEFAPGTKEDRVLALGRFTAAKNQAELVAAFERHRPRLPGWALACVGGLADDIPADREYFDRVRHAGHAELIPNAPRERVRAELARARVFWHAMGIDVDEAREPHRIEHFGIATVEAMAAGCVPVVVNRGGQAEIVTDGETGFLCGSLDEFAERTIGLAADPVRAAKMAVAVRDAAARFARPVFEARMMALLRPHLTADREPL